jgi:exosome complex component RRP43
MSEENGIALMQFPKEVLQRLQPDLVFKRHLNLGLRPRSLMKFDECRDVISVSTDSITCDNQATQESNTIIVSSNTSKIGASMVIKTDISLGVSEVDNSYSNQYAQIWPEVVVNRGRLGAPTDEEMIASRLVYEDFIAGRFVKQDDLIIKEVGIKNSEDDKVNYDVEDVDEETINEVRNKYTFVLYAKINVYSREGPVYDHVHNSLMSALTKLQVPRVFIEEDSIDLKIPIKKSFNKKQTEKTKKTFNLKFDFESMKKIELFNKITIASNFGVVTTDPTILIETEERGDESMDVEKPELNKEKIMISDISSDIEEQTILSRVSVSCNENGYSSINLVNGHNLDKITINDLKKVLEMAKLKHKSLYKNLE